MRARRRRGARRRTSCTFVAGDVGRRARHRRQCRRQPRLLGRRGRRAPTHRRRLVGAGAGRRGADDRGGRDGRAGCARDHPLARRPDAPDEVPIGDRSPADPSRGGSSCAPTVCGTTRSRRRSWRARALRLRPSAALHPGPRPGRGGERPRRHDNITVVVIDVEPERASEATVIPSRRDVPERVPAGRRNRSGCHRDGSRRAATTRPSPPSTHRLPQ